MKAHSEFNATSAARLIACPGSFRLTRELKAEGRGPDRPSVYAAQGTVAHKIAEELLAHRGDKLAQANIRGGYMLDEIDADGHADHRRRHLPRPRPDLHRLRRDLGGLRLRSRVRGQKVSPDIPWRVPTARSRRSICSAPPTATASSASAATLPSSTSSSAPGSTSASTRTRSCFTTPWASSRNWPGPARKCQDPGRAGGHPAQDHRWPRAENLQHHGRRHRRVGRGCLPPRGRAGPQAKCQT